LCGKPIDWKAMTGNLFSSATDSSFRNNDGWFTAHCDGGSRGNPGPSGYGAVVEGPDGQTAARLSKFLGIQTNNYAEYSGLLAVLEWAAANGAKRLRVVSDSELMVKQMQGKYKVASPVLKPLFDEARRRARVLEGFEMRHTLRGGNKEADALANEAMDKGMGRSRDQGSEVRGQERLAVKADAYARPPAPRAAPVAATAARPPRLVLEGYVKGGVVHLVEGELPDGIFVKIVRE
jgi:ribonuclease HI